VVQLEPFTEEETIDYIKSHLVDAIEADIIKLASLLKYRPLELSLAVNNIKDYQSTIADYITKSAPIIRFPPAPRRMWK
jgi:hypothetical protein